MMRKHKILLISTGGTIAGKVAKDKISDSFEMKAASQFSELTMVTTAQPLPL